MRKNTKNSIKSLSKNKLRTAIILLSPAILYFTLLWVYPVFRTIQLSFFKYNFIDAQKFVAFKNYIEIFSDKYFWNALGNVSIYTVITVPVTVILAFLLALLVNELTIGKTLARTLIFVTNAFSLAATGIVFKMLFATRQGLINNYLENFFGIEPIEWLLNGKIAIYAIIIVGIWKGLGWFMLIYIAGLQNIDPNLTEAAKIDGANPFHVILYIIVPQLRPVILLTVIIGVIGSVQVMEQVMIMTRGGPARSTETIMYYIWNVTFRGFNVGYGTAATIIIAIILGIITLIQFKVIGGKSD